MKIKYALIPLILFITLILYASSSFAAAFGPLAFNPDNGHYYQAVYENVWWCTAKIKAENMMAYGVHGHLATITSQAENDWVWNNVKTADGKAPGSLFLGAYQPWWAPEWCPCFYDKNWHWVTGEEWDYTNWDEGEPNNWLGFQEDVLEFWESGGYWNDTRGRTCYHLGYLVEFPTMPVPEPASLSLLGIGLLGALGAVGFRKKK